MERARWGQRASRSLLDWYDSDGSAGTLPDIVSMFREGYSEMEAADALNDLQRLGQEHDAAPMLGPDRVVHSCQDGTPCEYQNQCEIGYCVRACDDLAMSALVGLDMRTLTEEELRESEYFPLVEARASIVADPAFRAKLDELYPDHGVCIARLCDEYLDTSGKLLGEIRRTSLELRHPPGNPLRICKRCGQADRSCICGRTGS